MQKQQVKIGLQAVCLLGGRAAGGLQAAENAGSALRDLEQRPLALPPEPPADTPRLTPPPLSEAPAGSATVNILGFRFTGNSAFSDEQLAAVLLDQSGQALTLSELQGAADRITRWYRDHDWLLARAIRSHGSIARNETLVPILSGWLGQFGSDIQNG